MAIQMLVANRSKSFGRLLSLTFAALPITASCIIFVGLMTRTSSVRWSQDLFCEAMTEVDRPQGLLAPLS
jgi:hypothetical protein